MKLEKINYVPVLNGSILNCALRDDMNINGKRSTFYTKDGIFKHNIFLINPYHHADIFQRIKDKGLLLDDSIILADSGGLQEITLNKIKYTPEEVFQWQQQHSHIGMSVDCLPFITPKDGTNKPGSFGGWFFDAKNFDSYAKKSKENIDVTKKYRDKIKYPNFNFYGIIQGKSYDWYLRWYKIIKDDVYLDGYSCKAPNVNPMTLAETCIFAINNIAKPIHFLGIGNLSRSIVLYYAAKYFKQPVTFDSSSYDIGTQYRSYLLPSMMNRKLRFVNPKNLGEYGDGVCNMNDIVDVDDLSDMCDCVVCQAIGDKCGDMIKNNSPILGGLLSVHNLIVNLRWIGYVKKIANNKYKLEEFVKYNFEQHLVDKILKAFDMIDIAVEKGHEFAFNKYKEDFQMNKEVGKQASIFDY